MSGKLFILSAPSGAGKTSLVQALLPGLQEQFPIERLVTYTSRMPRIGEEDAVDYHFIPEFEFEQKMREDFFLEWSTVYKTYYGSPAYVLDGMEAGLSYILIADREGARQIIERVEDAALIWVYTSDIQVLQERLVARGTDSAEQIQRRLAIAASELEQEMNEKLYKYHVCNDNFEQTVQVLEEIIQKEMFYF